jgi:hypothetical protein
MSARWRGRSKNSTDSKFSCTRVHGSRITPARKTSLESSRHVCFTTAPRVCFGSGRRETPDCCRDSHFGDRFSLKHYLAASHIVVATYGGVQTIPDKQLAAVGAKRSSTIRIPYFGVALQCLPGTELGADLDHWHDLSRQTESRRTPRKSTSRVASVLFLDGLASKAEQRSAACLAPSS